MNPLKFLSRGGASEPTDENFENTVLLLHGDGNQGATNFSNTGPTKYMAFTDNSTNNFPITVNGDAYGDNFSPFSRDEGAWSNFFVRASSQYLTVSNAGGQFSFGTGAFTIECWVNLASMPSGSGYPASYWLFGGGLFNSNTGIDFYINNTQIGFNLTDFTSATAIGNHGMSVGNWYHVVVVRGGSSNQTLSIYVNGTRVATASSVTATADAATSGIAISAAEPSGATGGNFDGYISNYRIVKGTAVYDPTQTTITVPTTPLTAISGTSLLTCQSNRFVDNSSNNFAITRNGDVTVSPFTPFTVTPNTTDGSGYFDGSDNLSMPSNSAFAFGTGAYTIEAWVYLTQYTAFGAFVFDSGSATNSIALVVQGNGALDLNKFAGGSILQTSSGAVPINAWTHIAAVRTSTSSNATVLYVNGVALATGTDNNNWTVTTTPRIGGFNGSFDVFGYISNMRVVKGTAVYTSNFTPPTAPLTAVSGTSLLACQYQGTVRNVGFIDSSPYDHRITRVGNTTQGSFSPFSKPDGRWGNYFDGDGDYLSFGTNTSFAFGTGDFTLEAWVYLNQLPTAFPGQTAAIIIGAHSWAGGAGINWVFRVNATTGYLFFEAAGGASVTSSSAVSINSWNHVAAVRSGTTLTLYLNGVSVGSGTISANLTSTIPVTVGHASGGGAYGALTGYVSNARIVKGTAVYTSNFTPSTTPLTAITNTSLLTCQSNRFIDNSTNNFTITRNGDVKVTPFSPFPITTAYDPAVNGGSGYFDGTGDTLQTSSTSSAFSFGTGDFTVEAWVYSPVNQNNNGILSNRSGGGGNDEWSLEFYSTNNRFDWHTGTTVVLSANTTAPLNAWNHIAVCRSGSSLKMYLNGVEVASATHTTDYSAVNALQVGGEPNFAGVNPLTGWISGARVIKGTALYTSAFTPPTAPPTAVANTSFLCNFTNAGIFDNTGFNNLETVGNAQIDTSVKKYGTGAMKFDGTGDGLFRPFTQDLNFGTGNFTIEWWMYFNSKSGYQTIISFGYSPQVSTGWLIQTGNGDGKIIFYTQSAGTTIASDTGSTVNTGEWYHMAVVRNSGTTTIYRNGTSVGSGADTTNYTATAANFYVGGGSNTAFNNYYFNGYIDDLRITKGIARYTSNFTPPTAALPDIGT